MFGFCSFLWKLCSLKKSTNNNELDKTKQLLNEKINEINRLNSLIASYKILLQRKNIQYNSLNEKLSNYNLLKEDYDKYQIIKNKNNKKQLEEIFNMKYHYIKKFYNELRDKRNLYAH